MKTIQTTINMEKTIQSTLEACGTELNAWAEQGIEFAFTTSDNVGADSELGRLMQEHPERCYDFGIAEANQVGASAGLALAGQPVYAKVFGPFAALRATDQLHSDIAYNDVPVRVMADHCGITAAGGPTHNAICDLAITRAMPNLLVAAPADAVEMVKLLRASRDYAGPMFIRLTKGIDPLVYASDDYEFTLGKAVQLLDGKDVTLIGIGTSVYWTLMAAKKLKEQGVNARVLNMHTLKPLDTEQVLLAARETGGIVTVEEHSIHGGLGGAVAEVLMDAGANVRFERIGFPDEFLTLGTPADLYRTYRMDSDSIAQRVLALLKND